MAKWLGIQRYLILCQEAAVLKQAFLTESVLTHSKIKTFSESFKPVHFLLSLFLLSDPLPLPACRLFLISIASPFLLRYWRVSVLLFSLLILFLVLTLKWFASSGVAWVVVFLVFLHPQVCTYLRQNKIKPLLPPNKKPERSFGSKKWRNLDWPKY